MLEIKSDGFHFMVLSLNWIEFRFWVEFLIGQFILEITFPFNLELFGKYWQPIMQVGRAYI